MLQECYPLNNDAWTEWTEFRTKEKRIKIGPMAERKQQKLLTGYPPPIQQEIVDQSIMNSWQGLFPPKNNRGNTNEKRHNSGQPKLGWLEEQRQKNAAFLQHSLTSEDYAFMAANDRNLSR